MARWTAALNKEIANLEQHGVFELVRITSVAAGHKVVGTRWLFKVKADSTYKGLLIEQDILQISGVNCGGTFVPVCRLQSICMMLATAAELDYEVQMRDVQMAFLNADVE